jgi:hypothetical protein
MNYMPYARLSKLEVGMRFKRVVLRRVGEWIIEFGRPTHVLVLCLQCLIEAGKGGCHFLWSAV